MACAKTIIISDVHLSNDANYSWFKAKPDAENLAKFLRRTANDPEVMELVLLGDFFDLWLYPFNVTPWNVEQITGQWGSVISALQACLENNKNVYYINGNHDMTVTKDDLVAAISPNIQQIKHEEYNKKFPHILHVEHGNDADMFNAPPPFPLGYLMTRLYALIGGFFGMKKIMPQDSSLSERIAVLAATQDDVSVRSADDLDTLRKSLKRDASTIIDKMIVDEMIGQVAKKIICQRL